MTMIELEPGQRFRGLSIHSLLGRNSQGAAYLASHPVLAVPLVVKTFSVADERLFQNARLLARVNSAHVVGVVDAGVENGMPFVVRQHVDGISLGELLRYLEPLDRVLPMHLLLPVVGQIAGGLEAMHLAGGVHGDIRPDSLFLAGDGRALIGDIHAASESLDMDMRLFHAPEIWQGDRVGALADIYALGVTAHYLATGAPPFQGDRAELERAHTEDAYLPPTMHRPESAYFFTMIASMLAKDYLDRPATAGDVARLLSQVSPEAPNVLITTETTAEIDGMYIEIYAGDIAAAEADVIVNSANAQLSMDAGVAEALRHAGGDTIQDEARSQGPATLGEVVWTSAGHLQGCWIAHAVSALEGALCIQRCTLRVLLEAQARGARSVVFPALGTGNGQVPMPLAAKLMLEAIHTFAQLDPEPVDQVAIALHDEQALEHWSSVLRTLARH